MLDRITNSITSSELPANEFDPRAYIDAVRAAGLDIYPMLGEGGHYRFAVSDPEKRGQSAKLTAALGRIDAEIGDASEEKHAMFHALCEDCSVDPNDYDLNSKVAGQRGQLPENDDRLIALCKRTPALIKAKYDTWNRWYDASEAFSRLKPKFPSHHCFPGETGDSRAMKKKFETMTGTQDKLNKYREYIRFVEAHEREVVALERNAGVTEATRDYSRADQRLYEAMLEIEETGATSLIGLSFKAALLAPMMGQIGGMEELDRLIVSISVDAQRLNASAKSLAAPKSRRRARPAASDSYAYAVAAE